ncbi:MAG TPA: helix-turn-helix domain-containing protein [Candidatus Eisenbacteria bacterium]|nr:helix-turn-helix domain-containing protein [Candidatus Eisenbacteria bacterium]
MVIRNTSPFGSQSRTQVLIALRLLTESHARELARLLSVPLYSVQQALKSLEKDGLVAARSVGRTRAFRINPGHFAKPELEAYVMKLSEPESELRERIAALRRRPRRTGKPL